MNCLLRNSRRLLLVCKQAGGVRRLASLLPPHANPVLRFSQLCRNPRTVAGVAALASGAAAMAALGRYDREVVPYTNRTHMVIRSPEAERQLWESRFTKDKKTWASKSQIVDPLHPDSVRVRRIADKIIRATYRTLPINSSHDGTKSPKPQTSHLKGCEWEVILVKDHYTSAMCAPGGKIVVYTGLLDRFTDAEIAFGIAHEIGHIVARHSSEIWYAKWFPLPLILPFFQRTEMEADHIGTLLLGAAGFHPYASLLFFRKAAMIERASWTPEDPIALHPSHKKRVERLYQPKIMEEAMKLYKEAPPDEGTSSQATGEGLT
ncbi:mitochondrial metalloendopeptidase OMA1-like [Aegilops tauschii subsp. strangulata]|uniref:mitochondrial metalloendopeptidase OMA1-like n=1 Tax=Aegilops tauschii subsp. strangulata TaxID=200361 RepID=UPI00098B8A81|nr:mitochondrial metalloendopeptidase OMA1-like [Aegilops tauschii subsp. strangulata]XP_020194609.1 mitochondrial metalloendopeptidase OMA1-like [Aegilops tauschii subsp. strangulata]